MCISWMQLWGMKYHQGLWGQKPWVRVQPLLLCLVFPVWPRTYLLNSHSFGLLGYKLWYPHLPPRASWGGSQMIDMILLCNWQHVPQTYGIKSGFYSNYKKSTGALIVGVELLPLHWSLEAPTTGFSHQRHRGRTHYYSAFTLCLQSTAFLSLMIS